MEEQKKAICKKCKGLCCKHAPGLAIPSDFEDFSIEGLRKAFLTGDWIWDNRHKSMRPKTVKEKTEDFISTDFLGKLGVCIALKNKGCRFPFKNRPAECKGTVPKIVGKKRECADTFPLERCRREWLGKKRLVKKAIAFAEMK